MDAKCLNLQKNEVVREKYIEELKTKLTDRSAVEEDALRMKISSLEKQVKHWKEQVEHPSPLDFPLAEQLREEIGTLQVINKMHGAEYDRNKKRTAEWFADLEKDVEKAKKHQAGWMKLMEVIHEADPVTGMW